MNAPDLVHLSVHLAAEIHRRIEAEMLEFDTAEEEAAAISAVVGFDVSEMPRDEQIGLYLGHRLFVISNAAAREFGRAASDRENSARRRGGDAA